MSILNKSIKFNDTLEITYGKLLLVVLITLFQFFGIFVENNFTLTSSMFFLWSNAFLALEKQKPTEEELNKKIEEGIIERNSLKDVIKKCEDKIEELEVKINEVKT